MARLHEYQGKALLKDHGLAVPEGGVVSSAADARRLAGELGGRVVLKVQAWITGRAARGGVRFADTPEEAADIAASMLEMTFGNFPVTEVRGNPRDGFESRTYAPSQGPGAFRPVTASPPNRWSNLQNEYKTREQQIYGLTEGVLPYMRNAKSGTDNLIQLYS